MALATLRVHAERVAPSRATFLGSMSKFAIDESSTCTKTNSRAREQGSNPGAHFRQNFTICLVGCEKASCELSGYWGRLDVAPQSSKSGFVPKLKVRGTVRAFGAVMAVGIIFAVTISAFSFNRVRIGGATYDDIVNVKDLVADILPPPLYVIEAYLEASLALNRTKPVADTRSKMAQLRKDYDERRAYWAASDIDPAIKKQLTEISDAEALKFWSAIEQKLVPALERNDEPAARQAYAEVTAAYAAHRAVIDQIVTASNALNPIRLASASRRAS